MAEDMNRRSRSTVHRFEFFPATSDYFTGKLRVPVLVVDCAMIELPELAFERRPFGGAMPLNC